MDDREQRAEQPDYGSPRYGFEAEAAARPHRTGTVAMDDERARRLARGSLLLSTRAEASAFAMCLGRRLDVDQRQLEVPGSAVDGHVDRA
jgi:hypothetical protein